MSTATFLNRHERFGHSFRKYTEQDSNSSPRTIFLPNMIVVAHSSRYLQSVTISNIVGCFFSNFDLVFAKVKVKLRFSAPSVGIAEIAMR